MKAWKAQVRKGAAAFFQGQSPDRTFHNFKASPIRRSTFLKCTKSVDWRIFRLASCEMLAQTVAQSGWSFGNVNALPTRRKIRRV